MYRTDFWTLWEKARVGCFKRTALKHVYYLQWNRSPAQVGCMRQVLGPGALGRPKGIGWRGRWEGGSGWGIHVTLWLIQVIVWQNPLQNCKVIRLQLKKKKKNNFLCPQPCPTLWDSMDYIPPGFSVYGILHTRTLEWVAISFSRGSSQPVDLIYVSCTGRQILYQCTTWEDLINGIPLTNLFFPERNPLMYWMGDLLAHSVVEVTEVIMKRSLMIPERSLERLLWVLMRLVSLLIRQ